MKRLKQTIVLVLLLAAAGIQAQSHWSTLRIDPSLSPKNDISAIQFDKAGNLWAATWCGVFRLNGQNWQKAGLSNGYVHTLAIAADGTKWAGTWGTGLFKCVSDTLWTPVKGVSSSPYTAFAAPNGDVWIGDWMEGVSLVRKGQKVGLPKLAVGDSTVTAIVQDRKGTVWIASYHGVTAYEMNGSSKQSNVANGTLPNNDVYALCADSKGGIWMGTVNGLVHLSSSGRTLFREGRNSVSSNLIFCIAEDERGIIWVGTDKGLNRYDGKQWVTYTMANSPLADDRVQTITIHQRKVYCGTAKGISILY